MKKVILAAAAFAAFTFNAKAAVGDSTIVNVNVTAVDMIQLTPDAPVTRTYTTTSNWNTWDVVQDLGAPITWTINATRGYRFTVNTQNANGFEHVGSNVAGVNHFLRTGRLGVNVSGVTNGTAGVGLQNTANIAPDENHTALPAAGSGLTVAKKVLGYTNVHGVLGGQVTTQLRIMPAVYDGLSGEYSGTVVFTAELNDSDTNSGL